MLSPLLAHIEATHKSYPRTELTGPRYDAIRAAADAFDLVVDEIADARPLPPTARDCAAAAAKALAAAIATHAPIVGSSFTATIIFEDNRDLRLAMESALLARHSLLEYVGIRRGGMERYELINKAKLHAMDARWAANRAIAQFPWPEAPAPTDARDLRIKDLEAALDPFARQASFFDHLADETSLGRFTVGDIRRAAKALAVTADGQS